MKQIRIEERATWEVDVDCTSIEVKDGDVIVNGVNDGHKITYHGMSYVLTEDMSAMQQIADYVHENAHRLWKEGLNAQHCVDHEMRNKLQFRRFKAFMLNYLGFYSLEKEMARNGCSKYLDTFLEYLLVAEWHKRLDAWMHLDMDKVKEYNEEETRIEYMM
jgi:hypothetical protein